MNTAYDPKVIQKFADKLYARARSIVVLYTVVGLLLGVALGAMLATSLPEAESILLVGGLILGGFVGWRTGVDKSFKLRLEAQMALCQAQIERHGAAMVGAGTDHASPAADKPILARPA